VTGTIIIAARAALVGAALAAGQVALAQWVGITTLDADFAAGEERTQGVQVTLLVWFAAVAVVVAVRATRAPTLAVPAAALAALAAAPVAAAFAGPPLASDVWPATIAGAILGAVVAFAVRPIPLIGDGVAAHAALVWLAALAFVLIPSEATVVTYAGLVEPLGHQLLEPLDSALAGIGIYDYHLPWMLPIAAAIVVLTVLLAGRARRRATSRPASVAAAVAGPVLAAATYWIAPNAMFLWNEDAARIALVLAACCAVAAFITAILPTRSRTRQPAAAGG
jgi:hypothetical protein